MVLTPAGTKRMQQNGPFPWELWMLPSEVAAAFVLLKRSVRACVHSARGQEGMSSSNIDLQRFTWTRLNAVCCLTHPQVCGRALGSSTRFSLSSVTTMQQQQQLRDPTWPSDAQQNENGKELVQAKEEQWG